MFYYRNSMPNINASIRFLQSAPIDYNLDVYISGTLHLSNLPFATISNYEKIAPTEHEIVIYKTNDNTNPIYKSTIVLLPNSISTISITQADNNIYLFVLNDGAKNIIPTLSYLRFINLSNDSPLLNLSKEDKTVLFEGVEFLETTNYHPLDSGLYNFILSETSPNNGLIKIIPNIDLKKFLSSTIYVIGQINGSKKLGYLYTMDEIDNWFSLYVNCYRFANIV